MNKFSWRMIVLGIVVGAVGVAVWRGSPVPECDDTPPIGRAFGWVPNPAAVQAVCDGLPTPHFADTEAFKAPYVGPDDVFLWDASRKVLGDLIPPRDQGPIGACVGFGTATAVEHLSCVQIAGGSREEFRELTPELIYAGSRVEIGGGRIRGDGSIGAWAARFVQQYGVVPRGVFGRFDLQKYDAARCRMLGDSGVPNELEPVAKQHPVKSITNVRSWPECRAAIRNGYPMIVCSSQGFRMMRDADGFGVPQGTWYHCMAIVGVCGGRRPGGFVVNSWGANAHSGPLGPGNPTAAGFWIDAAILERMLSQGDSWAMSNLTGFPTRRLDWYAGRERLLQHASVGHPVRGAGGPTGGRTLAGA